jgi:E3 ubiquitin-protein ligase DOA10
MLWQIFDYEFAKFVIIAKNLLKPNIEIFLKSAQALKLINNS